MPVLFWFLSIAVVYLGLMSRQINLVTADLGRHIRNGQMVVEGQWEVLNRNFYSFTHPEFPFVNHHWGSGVLFYYGHQFFGFEGLSVLHSFLGLAGLLLVFDVARKASNLRTAALAALLLIPAITFRAEVRPETFSYTFSALFFWILWHVQAGRISPKRLFILPALMLAWVNLHIYFFFGFILIGVFGIGAWITAAQVTPQAGARESVKRIATVGAFCLMATLVNPIGYHLTLFPLTIFRNYGYMLAENQSVLFFIRRGTYWPTFTPLFTSIVLLTLSARKLNWPLRIIALITATMALLAIRNIALFGLLSVPGLALGLALLTSHPRVKSALAAVCVIPAVIYAYQFLPQLSQEFGVGLMPGVNASAQFFQENDLKGPVFNNYDIGSYLILYLFPRVPVYVDNRPEAYSESFFQKDYIGPQENPEAWKRLEAQYDFNVIFFHWLDQTPWGQKFQIDRLSDPEWAPVFVDNYTLIFLRRNAQNAKLITKYEVPKSRFRTTPGQ